MLPSVAEKEKKDADAALPQVEVGQERKVQKASMKKRETKPPAQYTEATLLSAMENAGRQIEDEALREQMKDCGLGTPATRAAIIERILQTGYAKREKKSIVATRKGMQLIDILPEKMTSAVMTGQWEAALARMASGEAAQAEEAPFADGIKDFVRFIVKEAETKKDGVEFEKAPPKKGARQKKAPVSLGECPLCGKGEVLENSKAFYCSRWRDGCKLTWWKNEFERSGGPLLTEKLVRLLLEKKTLEGSTGTLLIDEHHNISFKAKG